MKRSQNILFPLYVLGILLLALLLRLWQLDQRPMHGDEAVNAYKTGQLLESGHYRYNPQEYHGPGLYYASFVVSKIMGVDHFQDLSETRLRALPALFGVGLILLLSLLLQPVSRALTLMTAILLSLSAPLLFYSRYYIHEMIFVFFVYLTILLVKKYLDRPGLLRSIAAGFSLALVMATKETWIIVLAAALPALGIVIYSGQTFRPPFTSGKMKAFPGHSVAFVCAWLFLVVLFYSDFFRDLSGLSAFPASFAHYLNRGAGGSVHVHPFLQYFNWLFFFRDLNGMVWSEALVGLSAVAGLVFMLKDLWRKNAIPPLLLFLILFALICALIFSLIPYKTPWNLLTFYPGLIVLAAFGLIRIFNTAQSRFPRYLLTGLLAVLLVHFIWQSCRLNFSQDSQPGNPWVYAHPTEDVVRLAADLEELSLRLKQGLDTPIQIIIPGNDYWPLPWYLRRFSNTGWWNSVPDSTPPAPLIITVPTLRDSITNYVFQQPPGRQELYVPLFDRTCFLRPGLALEVYARYSLFLKSQAAGDGK